MFFFVAGNGSTPIRNMASDIVVTPRNSPVEACPNSHVTFHCESESVHWTTENDGSITEENNRHPEIQKINKTTLILMNLTKSISVRCQRDSNHHRVEWLNVTTRGKCTLMFTTLCCQV